jgi:hypothetical protein
MLALMNETTVSDGQVMINAVSWPNVWLQSQGLKRSDQK